MNTTASIAAPMSGDKLYQERARAALPLLVRQAEAGVTIFYSDLAEELGMPNPRNLNYVLGSIGQTMEHLSRFWQERVPPIQCLVVNKNTGLPGEGIGWFLVKKEDFASLPIRRKRAIVDAELQHIFAYPKWKQVLSALSLAPAETNFAATIAKASRQLGGGESEQHRQLKEYVAQHPSVIGLASNAAGVVEYPLPSGDCLDVSFQSGDMWVSAEIKSALSNEADIARGLFQCVKYRAVQEAVLLAESKPQNVRAVLVLESNLPPALVPLRNMLSVEVFQHVVPRS
jgi:hypothetical protein